MLRIDPGVHRLAHVADAQLWIVVAFNHLHAGLFGAKSTTAAAGKLVEGGTPRLVGAGTTVDQPVHEFLAESGNAGNRPNSALTWPRFWTASVVLAGGGSAARSVLVIASGMVPPVRTVAPGSAGVGTMEISIGVQAVAVRVRSPVAGSVSSRQRSTV